MDAAGSRVFAVNVNLPRSYMGKAELSVGPDAVTLVARPIRHFRAALLSYVGVVVVVGAVVLTRPASLEVRSIAVGVIAGVLVGALVLALRSSRGEPHSMSLPPEAVSVAKRKGRVLVMVGAFDSQVRFGRWTLVADTPDDAKAMASTLATGGT